MIKYLSIAFILLGFISACVTPPNYDDVPEINLINVNLDTFAKCSDPLNNSCDTLVITVQFQDGDGDIGAENNDTTTNLFAIDTRTGFKYTYQIPNISSRGRIKAISGEFDIHIYSLSCQRSLSNPNPVTDTIYFDIFMNDRAGNKSNVITTDPVYLLCDS